MTSSPFLLFFLFLIICLILMIVAKNWFDNWAQSSESAAIRSEGEKFMTEFWGVADPKNYEPTPTEKTELELREYYTISKRQAKRTFSSAMLACYLGFGMFGLAVVISMVVGANEGGGGADYAAIGGAVVEIIAGLFFWMYTRASDQMKTYYNSLVQTYRYQQAKAMADELEGQDRVDSYEIIIGQMAGGGETVPQESTGSATA